MDAKDQKALLEAGGLSWVLPQQVPELRGRDPILGSRHRVSEVAACGLGLAAQAAAHLHALRGGPSQRAKVDVAAAGMSLLGFLFLQGDSGVDFSRFGHPMTSFYPTREGRQIHLHGGFPHLAEGLAGLLGCEVDSGSIAEAVAAHDGFELEEAIAQEGLCGAVARTADEWSAHPQGRALSSLPAVEILPLGEAAPRDLGSHGERPLDGVKVLDLTRVLAGPTCGRTLAEHGAQVLRIGSPQLPSIELFALETGRGKRNAFLDLKSEEGRQVLRGLLAEADIFCQSYRHGALERIGFGAEELAALRPGIVVVSVNCYGHVGPWRQRPGWEQLAQAASGLAVAEGSLHGPQLIPAAATDFTTGYLAAFGALEALRRRVTEGGSWHVRVSLCQSAQWITRAGASLDPEQALGFGESMQYLIQSQTAWGPLTHLGPVVELPLTPAYSALPPAPLGAHEAQWLPGI